MLLPTNTHCLAGGVIAAIVGVLIVVAIVIVGIVCYQKHKRSKGTSECAIEVLYNLQ